MPPLSPPRVYVLSLDRYHVDDPDVPLFRLTFVAVTKADASLLADQFLERQRAPLDGIPLRNKRHGAWKKPEEAPPLSPAPYRLPSAHIKPLPILSPKPPYSKPHFAAAPAPAPHPASLYIIAEDHYPSPSLAAPVLRRVFRAPSQAEALLLQRAAPRLAFALYREHRGWQALPGSGYRAALGALPELPPDADLVLIPPAGPIQPPPPLPGVPGLGPSPGKAEHAFKTRAEAQECRDALYRAFPGTRWQIRRVVEASAKPFRVERYVPPRWGKSGAVRGPMAPLSGADARSKAEQIRDLPPGWLGDVPRHRR